MGYTVMGYKLRAKWRFETKEVQPPETIFVRSDDDAREIVFDLLATAFTQPRGERGSTASVKTALE